MERQDHHVAVDQRGSRNGTARLRRFGKIMKSRELIPLENPKQTTKSIVNYPQRDPSKQLNPELIPLKRDHN